MPIKKRLEGIELTDIWKKLLEEAQTKAKSSSNIGVVASNDDMSSTCTHHNAYYPMSESLALSTLRNYYQQQKEKEGSSSSSSLHLPIKVVLSIAAILGQERVAQALQQQQKKPTQSSTKLAFTKMPDATKEEELTEEQKRFRRRMERLQLKQEEEKYGKLTHNLGLQTANDDDITTKSMTYAASIGLNMIVAPLSFGCFMWFFAGNVIDYFWPVELSHPGATDIRRVIVGVTSGVLMLFIEMLLFVIRTHELDRAMRRKSKQKKSGPFGYYTSETVKTYKED